MILGAGAYQVPLIQKAKEMGCYTIVVSIPGNYPGFSIADKFFYENTTDKEACLRIAKDEQIDAVCTTGTDVALPTLGYIVDSLGLSGPSEFSAIIASNKYLMKEKFVESGVRVAEAIKVYSQEECLQACARIGYPCVLKVVDSSGSRGICVVKAQKDVVSTYENIIKYTRQDYILVEQYLFGTDFGAQAFVCNGQILFVIAHTTDVYKGDTGVPIGHTVPYLDNSDGKIESMVTDEITKAIRAVGIDNSAVNADLMLVEGKPYVLEIGARCGATCLAEIDSLSLCIDMYEMIVKVALGELNASDYENVKVQQAASALLLISKKSGVITSYQTPYHEQLYDFKMDYKIGDFVEKFHVGPNRLGHIIVTAPTKLESEELVRSLIEKVELEVK